ncbi:TPA: PD-(D/E)XK nuclease family protein [Serratia fonticola]
MSISQAAWEDPTLSLWLRGFLREWPENSIAHPDSPAEDLTHLQPVMLEKLLDDLGTLACDINLCEMAFNPWVVAGLERKELPNASVLTWLLDPSGSHGLGSKPLKALLSLLIDCGADTFPLDYQAWCGIAKEIIPTGNQQNRVDIEIDADTFYLLIEVKINAGEQQDQLQRYQHEAISRAGKRPWAILFLTPQGRPPSSGDCDLTRHLLSLSWHQLASHLACALRVDLRAGIASTIPMRQMACGAVNQYLDHTRQF